MINTDNKYIIIFKPFFLALLFFMLLCNASYAQQSSHFSQYVFNNYVINPAAGGVGDYVDLRMGYRNQWIGFGAQPQTYFISVHTPLSNLSHEPRPFGTRNHHVIGGYAIKDETGPISQMSGYLSYAYHMRLSYQLRASFGFFGGWKQYGLNTDDLWTAEPDLDLVSFNTSVPDAAAGAWVYSNKYFMGLSVHQLIPIKFSRTTNKLNMHYYLTGGYSIPLYKIDSKIIPSANVRFGLFTPVQIDLNVKFNYRNILWAGLAYRKIDALIGLVGLNLNNYFQIGYAFDFTLSKLAKYSSNTHEIMMGFRFKPNKRTREIRCPDWG